MCANSRERLVCTIFAFGAQIVAAEGFRRFSPPAAVRGGTYPADATDASPRMPSSDLSLSCATTTAPGDAHHPADLEKTTMQSLLYPTAPGHATVGQTPEESTL